MEEKSVRKFRKMLKHFRPRFECQNGAQMRPQMGQKTIEQSRRKLMPSLEAPAGESPVKTNGFSMFSRVNAPPNWSKNDSQNDFKKH